MLLFPYLRQNITALAFSPTPDADDTYDLGSASKEWRNLYIDGTANIDSLVADTADINGGSIDAVTIGTNSPCTQLAVDNIGINGNTISSSSGSISIIPVAGSITIIGDAGSTSHTLNTNDDLLVTGRAEINGYTYCDGGLIVTTYCLLSTDVILNNGADLKRYAANAAILSYETISEEVTIPVGSGNTPVVTSSSNLAPANSTIKAVAVRVTQAPGGGATVISVGRSSGGNTDEFIDDISTSLNTTGNSIANNDGVLAAEDMWNVSADTFEITTDADVTGTDMKLRIVVWYEQITAPTS